jgi:hypothetical protein
MKDPQVIDDKSGILSIRWHMGEIKIRCDISKWIVKFGLAGSGSSMRISFHPKEKETTT